MASIQKKTRKKPRETSLRKLEKTVKSFANLTRSVDGVSINVCITDLVRINWCILGVGLSSAFAGGPDPSR